MFRFIAGISFLLLIGLLTGASMLVYAAYVLVAIYWLTRYLSRQWADALEVTRQISAHELEIGQTVAVNFKLTNRARVPIVWILLEDVLPRGAVVGPPPALKVEGSNLRLASLPAGSPKLHSYKLTTLRRGYFQIGPLIAETGDLFGLHRRFKTVSKFETLLVLPKIVPLVGYDVASQRPVGEVKVTYRLMEDPTLVSGFASTRMATRCGQCIGELLPAPPLYSANSISPPAWPGPQLCWICIGLPIPIITNRCAVI